MNEEETVAVLFYFSVDETRMRETPKERDAIGDKIKDSAVG